MKITLIILLTFIIAFITMPAFAVNRVLSLDGDGDYVQVPDADSLDLTANFTFEAWVFPATTSGVNTIFNFDASEEIATDASESHSNDQLMGDAHVVEAELPKPGELIISTVLSGMITNEAGQPTPIGINFSL